jgi:propionyl-CoA carboxylase beta chain
MRLSALYDPGTVAVSEPDGVSGVVTASGLVNGQPVLAFSQDVTVIGGSVGAVEGMQISDLQQKALELGVPIIGIWDGGGARIQDGVSALAQFGKIFSGNVAAAGKIPQLSLVLGTCAGGACYSPALTDFVIMVTEQSRMFLTGPYITQEMTGEAATVEELGGCQLHNQISGVAHFAAADEDAAIAYARELLAFFSAPLPDSPKPPADNHTDDNPEQLPGIPLNPSQPYDVHALLANIFDKDTFLEVQPNFARNLVTGYARLAGNPVAIIANQPTWLAGALDTNAAKKAARFVKTNTNYNLPIITIVDVPGFLPGVKQEGAGIITAGAELVKAYANAKTKLVTLITRKAYGGAFIALGSKSISNAAVIAWPQAQIGVMDAEAAMALVHRRELAAVAAAKGEAAVATTRTQLAAEYRLAQSADHAEAAGQVDSIVTPENTRAALIRSLQ